MFGVTEYQNKQYVTYKSYLQKQNMQLTESAGHVVFGKSLTAQYHMMKGMFFLHIISTNVRKYPAPLPPFLDTN